MCAYLIPIIVFVNLMKNYTKTSLHSFCVLLGIIIYFNSDHPAEYYIGLEVFQGLEPTTYRGIESLLPLLFGYIVYKFTFVLLRKYSLLKIKT